MRKTILGVVSVCLLLAGCGASLPQFRARPEGDGEVYLYLQPFPQEADRLAFDIGAIAARSHDGRHIAAAAGWRSAATDTLFLERYLDMPIELAMAQLADQPVARDRIVEVGNLAAEKNGSSVTVILALADHLDRLGYEWVVFTATSELIGIFSRLGLPLLALAPADPARLGEAAKCWGCYCDTQPIVVAGRIRMALERAAGGA